MQYRAYLASGLCAAMAAAQSSTTTADQTVISVFMIGAMGDAGPEAQSTVGLFASIVDSVSHSASVEDLRSRVFRVTRTIADGSPAGLQSYDDDNRLRWKWTCGRRIM